MPGDFGVLLRRYRLQTGWTQEDLAGRSGVSVHAISVLEAGRRKPRLSSVARLAEALALAPPERARLIAATDPAPDPAPDPDAGPEQRTGSRPEHGGVRYQLPADTRLFTGRTQELEQLLALAEQAPEGNAAGMVVISAIDGMGGIGKSALALHAAHRLRPRFPDGQLFVDLHGHTPGTPPLGSDEALSRLLRSLGVPPQRIPADLGERAACYRDRLADTRTLIVLDNAADSAQVRPLLPGTPGCLVLVTSRKRLVSLDDAHLLALDLLSGPEAAALLHQAAGPDRIPVGHPAVADLAELCGHLPLALRIAAARLRHQRTLRIEHLVGQLRDGRDRLTRLQDEDRSLAAVFESSLAALPDAEQQLFRRLGLIPGPDFDAHGVANLAGTDHRTAERLLESLLDHNLLTQHTPGRYGFHDLIRLHARTRSDSPTESAAHGAALERLLDYYQHTARLADHQVARRTRPQSAPTPPAGSPPLPDRAAALAWLRAERANLLAATAHTTARAQYPRTIALTASLASFLLLDGPWAEAAELHRTAAAVARELGDRLGEAGALGDLGRTQHATGNYPGSAELYQRTLTLHQELGDRPGEADSLHQLGRVRVLTGDYLAAAELHERAALLYRELGDRPGEARALCDLGRARHSTGDPAGAAELMTRVLTIQQELGDRRGQAGALHDLGYVRHETGDHSAAAALHEQALAIYLDLGSRQGEAIALWNLGQARHETGDHPAAAALHERALVIFRELGSRQGEADALHGLGRARHRTGDLTAAAELYRRALPIYREVGSRPGETELLTSLAALTADTTGPQAALPLYRQALRLARLTDSPLDQARALEGAARCAADLGDRDGAVTDLRAATELYRRVGAPAALQRAADRLTALERPHGSVPTARRSAPGGVNSPPPKG
ncbi:tetratricopeptide repeat protein [Kitasatospora sp. NPDC002040]|uniref:ATP-binding protein n=1 Tax=Kitasatospora sp. NPDC002040 TaxID=3154661 RepID=UPI00332E89DA